MQVSRFAVAAELVDERELARDLGPLCIFRGTIISQWIELMKHARSASTIHSNLVHLKRGCKHLKELLFREAAWEPGQASRWAASFKRTSTGTYDKVPMGGDVIKAWMDRLSASLETLDEYCTQWRAERESRKTVGQTSFRKRYDGGELMCVLRLHVAAEGTACMARQDGRAYVGESPW